MISVLSAWSDAGLFCEMFTSYDILMTEVKKYEEANTCFYVRDTISAAKGLVKRTLSDDLKFYELTLSCIHGGKNFKPRGNGQRATMYVNSSISQLSSGGWGGGGDSSVTLKGLRPGDQT